MFIESVKLHNFRSVKDAEFTFKKGLTCFLGNNGEGKSTVLNAISMLLFDSYTGTYKDYINWDADEFEISIDFSHNGNSYFESFKYSLKSSDKLLRLKNTNEEWINSSAVSKLKEIFDVDTAMAAIVANQDEQNLITTTPAKRREYLKSVYNLDFEKEQEIINSDIETTKAEIAELTGRLSVLENKTFDTKSYKEQEYTKEQYEDSLKSKEILNLKLSEIKLVQEKKENIEKSISSAETMNRRFNSLIDSNKLKIDESNKVITKTNEEKEALSFNNEKEKLQFEFDLKIKSYNSEVETLNLKKRECESKKEQLGSFDTYRASQIRSDVVNTYSELSLLKNKLSESDSKIEVMKKGKCPTCGHDISEEELNKEVTVNESLKKDYSDKSEAYKNLLDEETRLEDTKRKHEQINNELSEIEKNISLVKNNIEHLEKSFSSSLDNLKLTIETKEKYLDEKILDEQKNITDLENEIKSLEQDKNEQEKEIEKLRKEYSQIKEIDGQDKTLSEINRCDSVISSYEDVIKYNQYVDEFNEGVKKEIEQNKKDIEIEKANIEEKEKKLSMIELSKTIIMKEFPSFIMSYMISSLEDNMNEFLMKVYPKYQIKIKESKNSLAITYGPKEADCKFSSGFEKSIFSLSWMYALGKLQGYGLLMVDEVDAAASEENAVKYFDTLGKSLDYFPQIFCITHKEEAKELLRNNYNSSVYVMKNGEAITE